ncbi:MAG: hypothetical protein ACHQQQ_00115 [Bacteroidota bacterium]
MFTSTTITGRIPTIRIEYCTLRETLDPRNACLRLARLYGVSIELARKFVSLKESMRICSECWEEYFHTRNDNRHICDTCLNEVQFLENSRKYEESLCRRFFPTKFQNEEETISRTIIMLTTDYGMSRDEALGYISEVQLANEISLSPISEEF